MSAFIYCGQCGKPFGDTCYCHVLKRLEDNLKTHALMLLNLYGVEERLVKENPEALNVFLFEIKNLYGKNNPTPKNN